MSRDDLLATNAKIMKTVVGQVARYSPQAVLIIVSNPSTPCATWPMRPAGFPGAGHRHGRRAGFGPVPDLHRPGTERVSGKHPRLRPRRTRRYHGAAARFSSVAGIPITELLDAAAIERLVKRTRDGGAEIVSLLKTGSAFYAPLRRPWKWPRPSSKIRRRSCPAPPT